MPNFPVLSPQDCVQLNQYKLKDEIGKVKIGFGGGMRGFGLGGCQACFHFPVMGMLQIKSKSSHSPQQLFVAHCSVLSGAN